MLLKPNMILPGEAAADRGQRRRRRRCHVGCFLRVVPAAVPGIAFLSGGQPSKLASAHLNAMNVRFRGRMPWALAFSFARAIQQPALELWRGRAGQRRRRAAGALSIAPTATAPPAAANTTPAPTRRAPPERIEDSP
jgi:fructose-bisphosphate aldolase class 1